MSSVLMTAPEAGWYQDPADAGAWRWWDGTSWTDHIRAASEVAQTAPVQAVPAPETYPQPVAVQAVPEGVVIEPVPTHPPVFEQIPAAVPTPAPAAIPQSMAVPEPIAVPEPMAVVEPPATPAAVAPDPVPVPAPAQSIPQPGQVAAAPTVAAPQSAMTHPIPETDQKYWHSDAAEKIEVPRLAHPGTGSIAVQRGTAPPSYVRDWSDLGSPNTGGVWLMAIAPLLAIGIWFVIDVVDSMSGNVFGPFADVVIGAVSVGLTWIFAYADQRALTARGYHPPAIWWMLLLPPLIYLIARGRVVRREGMRAWPPELMFVVTLLIAGGFVAISLGALTLLGQIG